MKQKNLIIIVFAALAIAASCTKEYSREGEGYVRESDGCVTVPVDYGFVSADATRSSVTTQDNSDPTKVTVNNFAFGIYADGKLDHTEHIGKGQSPKLSLRRGVTYRIYSLMNVGTSYEFPALESEIGSVYYGVSSLGDINASGFPFAGPVGGTGFVAGETPTFSVTFRNLMARINVSLDRSSLAASGSEFTLTSLRLVNSPKGAFPFRGTDAKPGSRAEKSSDVFSGDSATDSDKSALNSLASGAQAHFYVFENMQGDLTPVTNTDPWKKQPQSGADVCTYIEIVGIYKADNGALTSTNTYRMYLGNNATCNYDIERNTVRTVSVKLTDDGYLHGLKGDWKVTSDVTSDGRSISITPSSLSLGYDETASYTVNVNPAGMQYTCSLSDNLKDIITLDENLKTVKLGTKLDHDVTGTLTATSWDGAKTASCAITARSFVVVNSIAVSPTAKSIFEGGTFQITATVTLSDGTTTGNCAWLSSDPSVATVDVNGNVRGIAPGTATITASAGGKTATCTVTVKEVGTSLIYGKPEVTVSYTDVGANGTTAAVPTVSIRQTVKKHYEDERPDEDQPDFTATVSLAETSGDVYVSSLSASPVSGTGASLASSGENRGKVTASSRAKTTGDRRKVADVTLKVTANGQTSDGKTVAVYQQENRKELTTDETPKVTTGLSIALSPSTLPNTGGTVTVTGTRTYSYNEALYTYTSGATEGGETHTGSEEITLSKVTVSPAGQGATVSGNTITVGAVSGSESRSWTVTGEYDGKSATGTLTQSAVTVTGYSEITLTLGSIGDIPASGGTSDVPQVTYTQTEYYSDGSTKTITTGATVTYGLASNPTSTDSESCRKTMASLEKTEKGRTKVATAYVKVSLNGKTAQKTVDIYQAKNERYVGTVYEKNHTKTGSVSYGNKTYGTTTYGEKKYGKEYVGNTTWGSKTKTGTSYGDWEVYDGEWNYHSYSVSVNPTSWSPSNSAGSTSVSITASHKEQWIDYVRRTMTINYSQGYTDHYYKDWTRTVSKPYSRTASQNCNYIEYHDDTFDSGATEHVETPKSHTETWTDSGSDDSTENGSEWTRDVSGTVNTTEDGGYDYDSRFYNSTTVSDTPSVSSDSGWLSWSGGTAYVSANNSGSSRTGHITATNGSASASCTVTQAGKQDDWNIDVN